MNINKFAHTIQDLRIKANLTQKEVAEAVNVTPTAVSKWERGLSYPDITLFPKLAVLLDMDIETLLCGNFKYSADSWVGVIDIGDFSFSTKVGGKPVIQYLITYFMLAGIMNIYIVCNNEIQQRVVQEFSKYDIFSINFRFVDNIKKLSNILKNLFVIKHECILYGVDLTRHFQRVMAQNYGVTICYSKSHYGYCPILIKTDNNRRIINFTYTDNKEFRDIFFRLPIIFISSQFVQEYINANEESFIQKCFTNKCLYGEVFPRGMIVRSIATSGERDSATTFIEGLKKYQGEDIGDLEEIAKNRDLYLKT